MPQTFCFRPRPPNLRHFCTTDDIYSGRQRHNIMTLFNEMVLPFFSMSKALVYSRHLDHETCRLLSIAFFADLPSCVKSTYPESRQSSAQFFMWLFFFVLPSRGGTPQHSKLAVAFLSNVHVILPKFHYPSKRPLFRIQLHILPFFAFYAEVPEPPAKLKGKRRLS